MRKIKIKLYPSIIGELLEKKVLKLSDLGDCEKISTILSEYSVQKIIYLNNDFASRGDGADEILHLDIFKGYVSDNSFGESVTLTSPSYTVGGTLNALCRVGDERLTPVVQKSLHNFALRFDVARIDSKTYAVIFKPLCEVDSPLERTAHYLKDMKGLLSEISLELNDTELLEEELYQQYVSLM